MTSPFGRLAYLYVGSSAFDRDLAWYRDTLGAPLVWSFARFGARVAAFRLGEGPLLLIADHRPAPSCIPIWQVEDLERTAATLRTRGWTPVGDPFELPEGPCYRFDDPGGNPYAIMQVTRPGRPEQSYADPSNPHALR